MIKVINVVMKGDKTCLFAVLLSYVAEALRYLWRPTVPSVGATNKLIL
jgi:hypothetical protein